MASVSTSAPTRLRRTFNYPDSDSDNEEAEKGLNPRETLTLLSTADTTTTRRFTLLLLVLPLALIPLYLVYLLSGQASVFTALGSIASLAASALTLWYLPLPVRGARAGMASGHRGIETGSPQRPRVPFVSPAVADVVAVWIVPVNAAVCGVLASAQLVWGGRWVEGFGVGVGGGFVPGVVMGVVLAARRELRPVDLGELEGMRAGVGMGGEGRER